MRGAKAPLVADIHFNPQAAFEAAKVVEKVRINPGNFVDRVHTLKRFDYTDEEYQLEIEKIKNKLYPLLDICKEHHTAIRIGVNHGSLSDRILSRYGDTPQGMVESCLEFLRLCIAYDFFNIIISIKASNTVIGDPSYLEVNNKTYGRESTFFFSSPYNVPISLTSIKSKTEIHLFMKSISSLSPMP